MYEYAANSQPCSVESCRERAQSVSGIGAGCGRRGGTARGSLRVARGSPIALPPEHRNDAASASRSAPGGGQRGGEAHPGKEVELLARVGRPVGGEAASVAPLRGAQAGPPRPRNPVPCRVHPATARVLSRGPIGQATLLLPARSPIIPGRLVPPDSRMSDLRAGAASFQPRGGGLQSETGDDGSRWDAIVATNRRDGLSFPPFHPRDAVAIVPPPGGMLIGDSADFPPASLLAAALEVVLRLPADHFFAHLFRDQQLRSALEGVPLGAAHPLHALAPPCCSAYRPGAQGFSATPHATLIPLRAPPHTRGAPPRRGRPTRTWRAASSRHCSSCTASSLRSCRRRSWSGTAPAFSSRRGP